MLEGGGHVDLIFGNDGDDVISANEGGVVCVIYGVSVIGGVVTSTLLTLIAIPTFYEILDQARELLLGLARRVFGRDAMEQLSHATGEHQVGP